MSMPAALTVTSTTFEDGKTVPKRMVYNGMGAGGENISPQIAWSGAPPGTQSFAVTIWDPDAPTTVGFWHWTLFNIPPNVNQIPEGTVPAGAVQGYTDFGVSQYGGPAPPPGHGPHHYRIRVYALDVAELPLDKGATAAVLMFMMRGHVLAEGEIVGIYER
ncbi:MAG: YbhB/YbcL family Raf kinase inhibitor-like protein [Candidatus Eremiobacteraeota bacterium]|nr:YbhB/YbcL family Raf kinase inhibitor-like protein [Candidatus Eremiobacteraeota bacterium]